MDQPHQTLITELRTERDAALAREAALIDVMDVINRNPENLSPVFNVVLANAIRLCESEFGIFNAYDGEYFHAVATQGVGHGLIEFLRARIRPDAGLTLHRIVQGENVVHVADITDDGVPFRTSRPPRCC
jgi:hypothetical protein